LQGALASSAVRTTPRHSGDFLALKLRASHLVEGIDFEPRNLPPGATLIVRRFDDPLPHGLRDDESALSPAPAWERAARSALGEIVRHAVRPAFDFVPATSNAVLFLDDAELLACFSRDLLHGAASSIWWWRSWLRSLPAEAVLGLFQTWLRNISSVPAALQYLANRGDATWIVGSFSGAQAWTLFEEIISKFDLKFLRSSMQEASRALFADAGGMAPVYGSGAAIQTDEIQHAPGQDQFSAPWQSVVPAWAVPTSLGPEKSALLGVSLMIAHSTREARTLQFANAFAKWYRFAQLARTPSAIEPDHRTPQSTSFVGDETRESILIRAEVPDSFDSSGVKTEITNAGDAGNPALPVSSTRDNSQGCHMVKTSLPDEPMDPSAEAIHQENPRAIERAQIEADFETSLDSKKSSSADAAPRTIHSAIPDALLSEDTSVQLKQRLAEVKKTLASSGYIASRLAGVFFLVNVMTALRLPESLEQACGCELGLSNWELLELIARCLVGPEDQSLANDPIWTLLAILDGRLTEEVAGKNFTASPTYRIPQSWISTDELSPILFRVRSRRIEFWSTLGFPLEFRTVCEPITHEWLKHGAGELWKKSKNIPGKAQTKWAGCVPFGIIASPDLRLFLAFLMPFLKWRLAGSLGRHGAKTRRFAEGFLLRAAKIWSTSTHIDLQMDLSDATAAIRMAGLDADPGWVPSFGRVIRFHYEWKGAI